MKRVNHKILQRQGWEVLAKGLREGKLVVGSHGYVNFTEYFKEVFGKEDIEIEHKETIEHHRIAPEYYACVIREMNSISSLKKFDHFEIMERYGTFVVPEIKWNWWGREGYTYIHNITNTLSFFKEIGLLN